MLQGSFLLARQPACVAAISFIGAALALAPAARAQIVYDQGGSQITVAADDGSNPQQLITVDKVSGMKGIGAPAVNPGGSTVVFDGQDPTFDPRATACGSDCVGVYEYANGTITRLSGNAPSCSDPCDLIEEQPEIGANGKVVAMYEWATYVSFFTGYSYLWDIDQSHSWTGLTTPPHGDPVDGPSPNEIPTYCSNHNVSNQPQYPGISPDGTRVVYVNCSDTSNSQYETRVENTNGTNDQPCGEDDQPILDPSFSLDASKIIDGESGDNPGLWSYGSACVSTGVPVDPVYIIAAPTGYSLVSPRYTNNGRILFVAQHTVNGTTTGDIWSIATTCGSGGTPCQFPADATQITHSGDVTNVAWTSQTIPLPQTTTDSSSGGAGSGTGVSTPTNTTPTPPPPPPPPAVNKLTMALQGHLAKIAKGISISVKCTLSCSGVVTVSIPKALARRLHLGKHAVRLGSGRFSVPAGKSRRVRIVAARRYQRVLRKLRSLALTVAVKPASGPTVVRSVIVKH